MHVETHNPGAVPQRNGATSPIRPLEILGRPLMVLLLLAPALAANPPAYHRRALVELDNLDLEMIEINLRNATVVAEASGLQLTRDVWETQQLVLKHQGKAIFLAVDQDQNEETAKEYLVDTVPRLILFKNSENQGHITGTDATEFEEFVNNNISV
jgi:hypothetical protein